MDRVRAILGRAAKSQTFNKCHLRHRVQAKRHLNGPVLKSRGKFHLKRIAAPFVAALKYKNLVCDVQPKVLLGFYKVSTTVETDKTARHCVVGVKVVTAVDQYFGDVLAINGKAKVNNLVILIPA